jgi:predicted RNase H-like HicB family nuclease
LGNNHLLEWGRQSVRRGSAGITGCAADGKTWKEALANAEFIIPEWIETAKALGRPIPQPKGRLMYA